MAPIRTNAAAENIFLKDILSYTHMLFQNFQSLLLLKRAVPVQSNNSLHGIIANNQKNLKLARDGAAAAEAETPTGRYAAELRPCSDFEGVDRKSEYWRVLRSF